MTGKNIDGFVNRIIDTDLDNLSLTELVGLKIEYIYLVLDYSQLEFSLILDTNLSYLHDIMRGRKSISVRKVAYICSRLQISPIEFFNFKPLYDIKAQKVLVIYDLYKQIKIEYI